MGLRQWCIAALVLQVWGGARARPSEAAVAGVGAGAVAGAAGQVVDRSALLNGCPSHYRPHSHPPPQELVGEWCGLENTDVEQNATGTSDECRRTTLAAAGDRLRLVYRSVRDSGDVVVVRNVTFSRLPNEGWALRTGQMTTNIFIGFSADRQFLLMCGTSIADGGAFEETFSVAYLPCLAPGEDPARRRDVARCDLPPARG